jgi:hypothetical protein
MTPVDIQITSSARATNLVARHDGIVHPLISPRNLSHTLTNRSIFWLDFHIAPPAESILSHLKSAHLSLREI